MKNLTLCVLLSFASLCLSAGRASAASGDLGMTFDGAGKATTDFPGGLTHRPRIGTAG